MSSYADDAERYRLDSRIATGGMGEVWRATDTTLGREVAVKLLKTEYADDPTFRARFETEARNAAALHHPGVAGVFDVGESEGQGAPRPFLVMELVDGETLSTLLSQAAASGRTLDADVVRDLMAQTGEALGAAHRAGIVHRDVKPANLIVTPDGVVKVTDFGIARAVDSVAITRTGAVMGTPQYLSPEQAEGKPATSASDVYALGVVAYECLAGRRPFEADSPVATALAHLRDPVPELPSSVPADLAAVVTRALAKKPAERYADGTAFAGALRDPRAAAPAPAPPVAREAPYEPETRTQVLGAAAVAPLPPVTTSTTTTTVGDAPGRRSPWPIVAAVVLLVALAVVLTLLLTGGDDDETPVATDPTSRSTTPSTTPSEEPSTESSPPETSEAPPEPETATFSSSEFEGRPVDDVLEALDVLGFENVGQDEVDNPGDATEGTVQSVDPQGTLELGEPITVYVYGAPPVEETPTEEPSDTTSETPGTTLPGETPTTEGAGG